MKAVNLTTQKELAGNLTVAGTAFSRMRGLLGKTFLPAGDGLWIKPCKGVHTFGMKFPIDVVFLDKGNIVIATIRELSPNRLTPLFFKASSVLELPTSIIEATRVAVGDRIDIV